MPCRDAAVVKQLEEHQEETEHLLRFPAYLEFRLASLLRSEKGPERLLRFLAYRQ
jgi:hypothetical protein